MSEQSPDQSAAAFTAHIENFKNEGTNPVPAQVKQHDKPNHLAPTAELSDGRTITWGAGMNKDSKSETVPPMEQINLSGLENTVEYFYNEDGTLYTRVSVDIPPGGVFLKINGGDQYLEILNEQSTQHLGIAVNIPVSTDSDGNISVPLISFYTESTSDLRLHLAALYKQLEAEYQQVDTPNEQVHIYLPKDKAAQTESNEPTYPVDIIDPDSIRYLNPFENRELTTTEEATLNSVVEIDTLTPEGITWSGHGAIVDIDGDLVVLTIDHVGQDRWLRNQQAMGLPNDDGISILSLDSQVTVNMHDGSTHTLGTLVDWQYTQAHPDDTRELGFAFFRLEDFPELNQSIQQQMKDGQMNHLYFDPPSIVRPGDKYAIPRADQEHKGRFQIVEIDQPLPTPATPTEDRDNRMILKDVDEQNIICQGMSGSPVFQLSPDGEVTNVIIGFISATELIGKDDLQGYDSECGMKVWIRPADSRRLIDEATGQPLVLRLSGMPDLGSKVSVKPQDSSNKSSSIEEKIPADNSRRHQRDPFTGKRTGKSGNN